MQIVSASATADYEHAGQLFREYAAALEIDLCFQNFERELELLPSIYGPPGGRLLLAGEGADLAGCVGVRRIEEGICEMKRLYVRPGCRGRGTGRLLATRILEEASALGYRRMRLDTLGSMTAAIALYRSLGFKRVEPYYHNPSAQAVFMEVTLRPAV